MPVITFEGPIIENLELKRTPRAEADGCCDRNL